MAGHAEAAHGTDRTANIMKFDGLPGKGKPVVQRFDKPDPEVPVIGSFVSTMEGGAEVSPFSIVSGFGDSVQKPKFTAKITLFDSHGDDNY